jgi:HD-GYP domain-containing protein (c-di-GMP phosphodiesterase class II)
MTSSLDQTPVQVIHARHLSLLTRAAQLLGGQVQLWSTESRMVLSVPDPPPATAIAALREIVPRAAMHHEVARADAGPGAFVCAIPVRTREGLAAVLSASLATRASAPTAAAGGEAPVAPELAIDFLGDVARAIQQQLDLLRENAEKTREILAQRAEQQVLHRVRARFVHPAGMRETLHYILEQGRLATHSHLALLRLADSRLLLTRDPGGAGADTGPERRMAQQLADRLSERMRVFRELRFSGPAASVLRGALPSSQPAQLAAFALNRRERPTGLLCLLRRGEEPFTPHDLHLLEGLAEQTLIAIRGGEVDDRQDAFLLSTVRALVSAIEAKDSLTSGHSTRVHLLSMLLGKELGLAASELESLKWASILHDIGKIGMPEAILNKTEPLTPEEFEIVKQHPHRGYQVLQHIHPLQDASQAVLMHHERYGGGGYPLGIAGERIPRAARIIAVADTFDALTASRPYRRSRSEDDAFAEICRVRGSQLDPIVVDALAKMLPFLRENLVMLESGALVA